MQHELREGVAVAKRMLLERCEMRQEDGKALTAAVSAAKPARAHADNVTTAA